MARESCARSGFKIRTSVALPRSVPLMKSPTRLWPSRASLNQGVRKLCQCNFFAVLDEPHATGCLAHGSIEQDFDEKTSCEIVNVPDQHSIASGGEITSVPPPLFASETQDGRTLDSKCLKLVSAGTSSRFCPEHRISKGVCAAAYPRCARHMQ